MIRVPRAYRGRTAVRFPVNSSRMCCVELALFYKNRDLICHSENIPPMLKGIAFNEESKSQPKRGGLWLRKRNFRTLDFDLEKGYWILLIQLLLLSIFNILIDVGSCWNRDSFFTFFLKVISSLFFILGLYRNHFYTEVFFFFLFQKISFKSLAFTLRKWWWWCWWSL